MNDWGLPLDFGVPSQWAIIATSLFIFWKGWSLAVGAAASRRKSETERYSHIAGRINQTVDEINSSRTSEHVAAIFALEGIALDSPREKERIMEFLAAYIRRNAVIDSHSTCPARREHLDGSLRRINAVLKILGGDNRPRNCVNLSNANLSEADLSNLNFKNAVFRGTNFNGAALSKTVLDRADLREATFKGANLSGASLVGANLYNADCTSAILVLADMAMANCHRANFTGAILSKTKLRRAIFINTILEGVDPGDESDLTDAVFGDPVFGCERGRFETCIRSSASRAIFWQSPVRPKSSERKLETSARQNGARTSQGSRRSEVAFIESWRP